MQEQKSTEAAATMALRGSVGKVPMDQKPTLMMMVNSNKNDAFDGKRSNVFMPTAKSELLLIELESHRKAPENGIGTVADG